MEWGWALNSQYYSLICQLNLAIMQGRRLFLAGCILLNGSDEFIKLRGFQFKPTNDDSCPSLIGENINESLCLHSEYSLMTELLNSEYKNPSFQRGGKEEVRNLMTIEFQNWHLELLGSDLQSQFTCFLSQ